MKRIIPRNPNSETPERRATVLERVFIGLGGAAICGSSIAIMRQLEPLSGARDFLTFPAVVGSFALLFVVATELQERLSNNDDGDGDGWCWRGPEEPNTPIDPNDGGNTLIYEIEEYLHKNNSVLV